MESISRLEENSSKNVSTLSTKITTDPQIEAPEGAFNPQEEASHKTDHKNLAERPPFAPFFTLINIGETTAHPRQVHYLFSDDDTGEVLTSALLRSLFGETTSTTSPFISADLESLDNTKSLPVSDKSSISSDISHRDSIKEKKSERSDRKGKEIKQEERVIIVDLNSTGDSVVSASSLSSKWQILSAQIEKAPTWNGADESNTEGGSDILQNMMLKIEGVANTESGIDKNLSVSSATGTAPGIKAINLQQNQKALKEEDMQILLDNFDNQMAILKRVMSTCPALNSKDTAVESGAEGFAEKE